MTKIRVSSWRSLPGPEDITRTVLPNGITILSRSNFESPSVVINGYLMNGSVFDPDEKLGLAYFTSLGLMRGTHKFNFQELYDRLESAGASLGFSTTVHTTSFGGRSLVEDISLLLTILADCIRYPTFPALQLELLRAQLFTSLSLRAQDTEEMASIVFDQLMFPKHPYGRPEDGFPETVKKISRRDIQQFHHNNYGPKDMVLVVVGALDSNRIIDEIGHVFGDWKNPSQPGPPKLPVARSPRKTLRKHISIREKTQTDLVMGTLGPRRNCDDFLSASLGNNILGQFGMMGRIGGVVREQAGLAYHASTSLNAGIDVGTWEVSAGVNPANLQKAIDLIIKELHRFISEPVTPEELQNSKSNFIGRLPLSLESNAGVASALLNLERFQLGLDFYQRYPSMVKAVTSTQVLETAQKYLYPEKLVIVSAGTEKKS